MRVTEKQTYINQLEHSNYKKSKQEASSWK